MSDPGLFDALKFSTQLQEAGFSQRQVDALTKSLQEALTATVATKADLAPSRPSSNTSPPRPISPNCELKWPTCGLR